MKKIKIKVYNLQDVTETKVGRHLLIKEREAAVAEGVQLLQFYDYEVREKADIVESMVSVKEGFVAKRYYARKLTMKIVDGKSGKAFCDKNHLKGGRIANWIALCDGEEIIGIMGWSVKRRGRGLMKDESVVKIERFCTQQHVTIAGGYSKLLKEVMRVGKERGGHIVENFVDCRYGTGDHLANYGFTLRAETIGWHWSDGKKLHNRLACKANMDERRLTEKQQAAEWGWERVYDSKQRAWIKYV